MNDSDRFAARLPRAARARARMQENVDPADYAWTVAEAAAMLDRSVDSVRRYIRQGELPAGHVEGTRPGEYRLRPTDVQALRDRLNDVIDADGDGQEGSSANDWARVADNDPERMHVSVPARMQDGDNDPTPRVLAVLDGLYQAQLAAKDAALIAKDEVIAELRRRAETAEQRAADRERLSQQFSQLQELRAADRERLARETARLQELRLGDRRQMAEDLARVESLRHAEAAELATLRAQAADQRQREEIEAITRKYQETPVIAPAPDPAPPQTAVPRRRKRGFWW